MATANFGLYLPIHWYPLPETDRPRQGLQRYLFAQRSAAKNIAESPTRRETPKTE